MRISGLFLVIAFATILQQAKAQNVPPSFIVAMSHIDNGRLAEGSRAIGAYCQSVLNAVPRLKPAEESWLTGEMSSTNANRQIKAIASTEYAQYRTINWAQDCQKIASDVSSNPQIMKNWLRMTTTLIEIGVESHLERMVRDVGAPHSLLDQLDFRNAAGRSILNNVIWPIVAAADAK